jgi:hypothetical protein
MSKRRLDVGAIVHVPHMATTSNGRATFHVEALSRLDNGIALSKIKSETEPFDRIVAECDLAQRP